MGENLITGLVTIALAIISLATLAVIVSKNAQTPAVINAAGNALGSNITAAVSPVTMGGGGGNGWTPIGGNGLY
jgi:hypothetical protein